LFLRPSCWCWAGQHLSLPLLLLLFLLRLALHLPLHRLLYLVLHLLLHLRRALPRRLQLVLVRPLLAQPPRSRPSFLDPAVAPNSRREFVRGFPPRRSARRCGAPGGARRLPALPPPPCRSARSAALRACAGLCQTATAPWAALSRESQPGEQPQATRCCPRLAAAQWRGGNRAEVGRCTQRGAAEGRRGRRVLSPLLLPLCAGSSGAAKQCELRRLLRSRSRSRSRSRKNRWHF
jgi:hypothetical protein